MIWLVEADVGGYGYQLLEVFSNEHAATSFVESRMKTEDVHGVAYLGYQPTVRGVPLLDEPPEPPEDRGDYRPLAWGGSR
jgi:hypothetical protein